MKTNTKNAKRVAAMRKILRREEAEQKRAHTQEQEQLTSISKGPAAARVPRVNKSRAKAQRRPRGLLKQPRRPPPQVLWHLPTRDQTEAALNESVPSVAPIGKTIDAYKNAENYIVGLDNPFDAPFGSMRLIDPYQALPVEGVKVSILENLAIANGTAAADGSVALILRGDTYKTVLLPGAIASNHAITWAGGSTYSLIDNTIYTSAAYYTRLVCSAVRIHAMITGDPHPISAYSYRITPNSYSTQLALGVASTNLGLSLTDRHYAMGAEALLPASGSIEFTSHGSRGYTSEYAWANPTTDRTTNSLLGYCIWLFGLRSTDRVQLEAVTHFEAQPINFTTSINLDKLAIVSETADCTSLVQQHNELSTSIGLDVKINTDEVNQSKVSPTAVKEVGLLKKTKLRDTIDDGITAITDIFTGNFVGAAKSVYNIAKRWWVPFTRPRVLHTVDGVITLPPLLNPQQLTAILGRGNVSHISPDNPDKDLPSKGKCDEEKGVPDIEDLPINHLSEATRTVNALTDDPVILTPKNARRPSLALSMSGRKK